MDRGKLIVQIKSKKTFLCIGLDSDLSKIPSHLLNLDDPIFEFNKAIIDATKDLCIAYKINTAFYESNGIDGWLSMQKTLDYIPNDIFTIADAKRGDIGNTSKMYAKAFFENLNFDSITVNPYMGSDSVKPFLSFDDKWVILLALTSNIGSSDFQHLKFDNYSLYKHVLDTSSKWGSENNLMYVVGATNPQYLEEIRKIIPNHFLLVPGIGAQGGSLKDVVEKGMIKDCGLIVNSSRSIIYAGSGLDFAVISREAALDVQMQMATYISKL